MSSGSIWSICGSLMIGALGWLTVRIDDLSAMGGNGLDWAFFVVELDEEEVAAGFLHGTKGADELHPEGDFGGWVPQLQSGRWPTYSTRSFLRIRSMLVFAQVFDGLVDVLGVSSQFAQLLDGVRVFLIGIEAAQCHGVFDDGDRGGGDVDGGSG